MEQSATDVESGHSCIAMISSGYGRRIDVPGMRRKFPDFIGTKSLLDVLEMACAQELTGHVLQAELGELEKLKLPCVILWARKRFVILERIKDMRIQIIDPYFGRRNLAKNEFCDNFSGAVLELWPSERFSAVDERTRVSLRSFLTFGPTIRNSVICAAVLSLALQALLLVSPLYFQVIIDRVIPRHDWGLLNILAASFACLTAINIAANVARGLTFQFMANAAALDLSTKLYDHLSKLSIAFFHQRSLGEVIQRFRSVDQIRNYVNNGSLISIADGTLVLVNAIMMFFYSPLLSGITLMTGCLYIAARYFMSARYHNSFAEVFETDNREGAQFFETVRGIQTIKIFNLMPHRRAQWQNLYIKKLRAVFRYSCLNVGFQNVGLLLGSLSDILVIFLAAHGIMSGNLTIGMVTAFLAYKVQFLSRFILFVDQVAQFRAIDAQVGRISEIVFSEQEPRGVKPLQKGSGGPGAVKFDRVSFKYLSKGPLVLNDVSLLLKSGEFVALIGASGCGKSTLLKLALGLYSPLSGDIYLDGQSLRECGPRLLRNRVGAVMQEDMIFTGSVSDNITLFDHASSLDRITECARSAQFYDVVRDMPGQFDTPLGDLGTALSAGQRQRLLIARALYRNPDFLIMDEGTANLDTDCEATIISTLRGLPMTKLLVAHSPAIAAAADSVYRITDGKLVRCR